jgi:hypothetical protein
MIRGRLAVLAAAAVMAGCSTDGVSKVASLYDHSPVPAVPQRTHAVATSGVPADGQYVGTIIADAAVAGTAATTITFSLSQAVFGDDCTQQLGAAACTNGFGTVPGPTATIAATAADLQIVSVVAVNRQNYAITGAELQRLAQGAAPASDHAPPEYRLLAFPFLLTVQRGTVIEARQLWLPAT